MTTPSSSLPDKDDVGALFVVPQNHYTIISIRNHSEEQCGSQTTFLEYMGYFWPGTLKEIKEGMSKEGMTEEQIAQAITETNSEPFYFFCPDCQMKFLKERNPT